jgi:hypothetical protein
MTEITEIIAVLFIMLVVAPLVGWLFFWGGEIKPPLKKRK